MTRHVCITKLPQPGDVAAKISRRAPVRRADTRGARLVGDQIEKVVRLLGHGAVAVKDYGHELALAVGGVAVVLEMFCGDPGRNSGARGRREKVRRCEDVFFRKFNQEGK